MGIIVIVGIIAIFIVLSACSNKKHQSLNNSIAITESNSSKSLVWAIQNKKVDSSAIFKNMLKKKEMGVNSLYEGKTPLQVAIQMHLAGYYDIDFVETLLDAGANPDLPFEFEGNTITPLMLLSHYHYSSIDEASKKILPIIILLLDRGASLNLETNGGDTPILYAAEQNNLDMVYFLLRLGADPLKTNIENKNTLEIINADNQRIASKDMESYNTLKLLTKFWLDHGGFGECPQNEFNWDFQDGKAYKEIILQNYITNTPKGAMTIMLSKAKSNYLDFLGDELSKLMPKETWLFFIKFNIGGIPNCNGDVRFLAMDLETGKNSQFINMRYSIENGVCIIEGVDRWSAQRLVNFIKDKESVYMYPNFTGELAGTDFSFYLNDIPSLIEYFQ